MNMNAMKSLKDFSTELNSDRSFLYAKETGHQQDHDNRFGPDHYRSGL